MGDSSAHRIAKIVDRTGRLATRVDGIRCAWPMAMAEPIPTSTGLLTRKSTERAERLIDGRFHGEETLEAVEQFLSGLYGDTYREAGCRRWRAAGDGSKELGARRLPRLATVNRRDAGSSRPRQGRKRR